MPGSSNVPLDSADTTDTSNGVVYKVMYHLMAGVCPEKCVTRSFFHCAETRKCNYIILDALVGCTARPYESLFGPLLWQVSSHWLTLLSDIWLHFFFCIWFILLIRFSGVIHLVVCIRLNSFWVVRLNNVALYGSTTCGLPIHPRIHIKFLSTFWQLVKNDDMKTCQQTPCLLSWGILPEM